MRPRETPVPIPNTMVKPWTADGTWLETTRESRWLPFKKPIMTIVININQCTLEPAIARSKIHMGV